MADDNKINYDSELTPEEKAEIQEALKNLSNEDIQNDEDFIKDIYGQADNDMSKVYEENNKNKKSILDKISKVLLYYTIADNVLKLSNGEYKSLFSNFSKTIVDMFKNHSELTKNVMEDTLNNVAKKVVDKYNLKKNQKQREKLVNEKYYGQHFSERVWDNEQEVAKQIQLEIQNLLLGKVSANQIAKNIQTKFDSNEYNAKRLNDTEISRIQDSLFRQKCHETGAKYVLYKATFCRTCKTCRSHHNITYKIDNAPLIPVHPNCHCYYTIVDNPLKAMNLQRFSNKSSKANDESDIINNREWLKAAFPNEKKFNTHVNKHSYQYGNISPNEYLELARKLLASNLTKDIDGFISADGFIFKYNKKTNDFAIGRPDGKISTLFKPDNKEQYWEEQKELFKPKEE